MSTRLKDIAILAGVSTATVSKVINGKDDEISDSTIRRVLRIAREQNYRPNSLARSMKTKITRTIGLIIPDVRNPFLRIWPVVRKTVPTHGDTASFSATAMMI